MRSRIAQPRLRRARRDGRAAGAEQVGHARPASRSPRWSWCTCGPARSTAAASASTCTREALNRTGECRRAALRGRRLARGAVLHRRRASRAGPRRSVDPPQRSRRRGARRGLGRGRRHFDDARADALVIHIAAINVWNRLNVPTRQVAGEWTGRPRRPVRPGSPGATRVGPPNPSSSSSATATSPSSASTDPPHATR